ncbi:sodium-dependent transporter [Helicobacter saguini]|uniref:Sodium-dependent transporter n=1 Tax=Helicobacter saguini TaxID=1548018 RepID=A0A347VMX2_9HELI|nr:sodium-dependent transporter [Helicobacter saguini]MWV61990.1 sodium-dependent transporter [Helicobacter saguini]MWV67336.1 sodium-dependent transporter [Helicobacter saguini]MWV69687.1 sodium-dependent transporter [Helicobacter saguini]MWV73095.1 sodium-dependent transporter [Helicobacter saguini]TLD95537.1 sodium-dependent transporter [Helicobacter saguini]
MKSDFGKLGFILAALGSSIGLGHIWRFPTAAGTSGGSAFVLLYLAIALTIGIAMLIAEMLIGQHGRKNVPDCFKEISQNKKTKWRYMGVILITGPVTLTFYCAVLGWVLYYIFSVSFSLPHDMVESRAIFESFSETNAYLLYQIACFGVILFATAYFVVHGISGIERLNFVLMPLLFFIFFGLLIYAMTLPSFAKSVDFMFKPDFSKLDSNVITDAMGQVFFSLSLGAGSILTYSSHISKRQNLLSSCLFIVLSGILISLIAGLMIFTFVFEYNGNVADGVGLIFITLPVMFGKMGAFGCILCVFFMVGLLFAGISSTVSLLEPCVKYLHDRTKKSRAKITYSVTFGIFLVGIIVILSMNESVRDYLSLFGKSLFELSILLSANILLTWGSFFGSIFIGYFVPRATLRSWTASYFKSDFIFNMWYYCLRILAPLMILIIFANKIYDILK